MLTPETIASRRFDKQMGGYKQDEVEEFLQQVAAEYAQLLSEKEELEGKIEVLAEKVEQYREDEDSLRSALIGAQKLGDSVIRESKAKADQTLREARAKADQILENAHPKNQDTNQIQVDTKNHTNVAQKSRQHSVSKKSRNKDRIIIRPFHAGTNPAESSIQCRHQSYRKHFTIFRRYINREIQSGTDACRQTSKNIKNHFSAASFSASEACPSAILAYSKLLRPLKAGITISSD